MIADGVRQGYLEARLGKKAGARGWSKAATARRTDVGKGLLAIAQRSGRSELAPIPMRAPDSPFAGSDISRVIAEQRAAIVAARAAA